MDNFETESNCSYYSDSLQSNASSLSGLSLYGNEFAELRHLVNPSKYPQAFLERSSTPQPELTDNTDDDKLKNLKIDLQHSLELNERYKVELHNLERKVELKFCDKIDKLLRSNSRLEGELENANGQIERLIKNYKDKHDYLVFKEKLDLEKKIYQLNSDFSRLQKQCAKIQQDKNGIDLENKNLKITLGELFAERDIKNSSVQSLKCKVSEQHVEIQNSLKSNRDLVEKLNFVNSSFAESEKSKLWYKDQLKLCQSDKIKLKEELVKCTNQVIELNERVSNLNITLTKYKNETDEVRLQALKEKEELLKKLENLNLECNILTNVSPVNTINHQREYDIQFYEQTVEDLKEEVSRIKAAILEKDKQFEKLSHENSHAVSKCLVLQQTLKQKEANIELLESSRNELLRKLEYLGQNERENTVQSIQLKNRICELEIEAIMRNQEKKDTEESIQLIREQFVKFKQNYEKVKNELLIKNKDILQLQKDKQELFMNNNWTICELEKFKQKDAVIEDLRKENQILSTSVDSLTQNIKELELQLLTSDEKIREKESTINELLNLNAVVENYKILISDYQQKMCHLQSELREMTEKFQELEIIYGKAEIDIKNKDFKLTELAKANKQQQKEHKKNIEIFASENNEILASYKTLQEKYNSEIQIKDEIITDLKNKLNKLENEWQNYLKRITDDQKVELLLNNQKPLVTNLFSKKNIENYVVNFFNNLNIDEFESSVDIRLKYLDERINKLKEKSEHLSGANRVKELEILLQVKDREMLERRKKMDTNNRTLLRKVKEHMRGRNAAEKQLKYLQDMYNTLADNHNTSELTLCSRESEIQSLQEFCDGYKKKMEKLRNTVVNLEQELSKAKICGRCIEAESVKEKLMYFERLCDELHQKNKNLEAELKCSQEHVNLLIKQDEEQKLDYKIQQQKFADILKQNEEFMVSLAKLEDVERENIRQRELVKKVENKLVEKNDLHRKSLEKIAQLDRDLTEAKEKIVFLSNEILIHSSNLHQKVEYLQELEDKILKLEEQFGQQNAKHENVIGLYKQRILSLQGDVEILRSDKFFLQRLSSDLKVALNSYVERNKKLQEQLKLLTTERQPFKSLPTNLLDDAEFSGKYDDVQITQLLEENRAPSLREPVTAEIRGCLNKLREEIFSLQDQISKKNSVSSIDMR